MCIFILLQRKIKMEEIKVSVIIPVYNVEKYLDKCIESILNQTLKEIEVMMVQKIEVILFVKSMKKEIRE